MLKKLPLLFLCLVAAALQGAQDLRYTVIESPYLLSTYYEMMGDHGFEGRVVKQSLRLQTTYELYDGLGDYLGKGVCRILSAGAFYAWAKEIDLYDHHKKPIGKIEGKTLTTARAKFFLYGPGNAVEAIAYQDRQGGIIAIVTPDELERPLGFLRRQRTYKEPSDWEVVLYDTHSLDFRLLKIFSAFIVDCQDDL